MSEQENLKAVALAVVTAGMTQHALANAGCQRDAPDARWPGLTVIFAPPQTRPSQ